MILLEYEEITIFFLQMVISFWFVKVGALNWRASKQSRKMIASKQYATKSLRKAHGIHFDGYAHLIVTVRI